MRPSRKSILSLVAAVLLLYLSLRKLEPHEIWVQVARANPAWLLAAVALNLAHYLGRAFRWRRMLEHFKQGIGLIPLLRSTFVGFLVTWVFPGRLGEFVRPLLLGRREGIPVSGAVSTVVLERVLDAASVLGLFAVALLWLPFGPLAAIPPARLAPLVRAGGLLGAAAILALLLLLGTFLARDRLLRLLPGRAGAAGGQPTLLRWAREFTEGFQVLTAPRRLLAVLSHSLGIWVVIGLNSWCALRAFRLDLPVMAVFLFLPLPVLGIAAPTPGGLGSFEFFCRWGLENLFGAPAPQALAASVGLHAVSLFPVAVFGPVAAWREGVSLRGLLRESREALAGRGGEGVAG
ncbi:MAG: flippase-like domain-containing protein [Acidobacteria bacterium]|nr:flippase-like domain-containing protein [Acidobacteriota bacterium]